MNPGEIDKFFVQFNQDQALMPQLAQMTMWQRLEMVTGIFQGGWFRPGERRHV